MKKHILIILLSVALSCSNYKSSEIKSPNGNYSLIIKINRTDRNSKFYAEPIFEIYDSKKNFIDKIESNTGDFNKWKVGWSKTGNTLILNSADIGIIAWEISEDGSKQKELNAELINQAKKLTNNL